MRLKKTPFALAVVALCGAGAIPLGAQTSSVTIEAESMTLSGYAIESGNRIRLTAGTGNARKNFSGTAGTYDLRVDVLPETDGRPTLAVYKGTATTPLQTFTYPLTYTPTSFTIKGVVLNNNETIRLVGTWNGGAVARVDKLVLTRVGNLPAPSEPGTGAPGTGAPYAGTPYTGTPIALPKAFEASKFDKGGQGVAYKDLTQGNAGGQFRTAEDVDIVASTDAQGGPYAVNYIQTGEWLGYTVNVPLEANYDLAIRASNNQATAAAFHIEVDGVNVTGSLAVPKTGSWATYQWAGKQGVKLKAGKRVIKVVSDQQFFNMSAISVLASAVPVPPGNTAPSVSLTAPGSGQTVSGQQVPYAATVSQAVTKVEFTVSSATPVSLGAKTAPPYSGTLDTTKLENGDHTLTAVAYAADGKTSTAQVAFKVQNGTPPTGGGGSTTKPANLLFWSGFESGVSVGAPHSCYSAGCWQDMLGTDSSTGFSWPPRIAGGDGSFQVRSGTTSTPSTISNYIVNDIQTVTGPKGTPTRAHRAYIKQTGCTGTASQGSTNCSAQDPYLLRPTRDPGDLYISYWRKIDPTLLQKLVNSWHVVFEWKTTGDYRVIANIVNYGGTPYWEIRADNVANGGLAHKEFWRVNNKTVAVPIGQWFKFEVFWHRSKGSDGRVWVAVNGQKLVDKFGPNIGVNSNPIDRIFLTQLYSGASYPLQQWTDDVQIWSSFPTAKAGDPWYDGVYAPH